MEEEQPQIRPAREEDVPAMLEVYRPYVELTTVTFEYVPPSEEEFGERFRRITERFPWYAVTLGEKVVGYAYASAAFERAAYQWDADLSIYLAPEARSRGVGRRLYAQLESDLEAMGYCNVYAIVTAENLVSRAFHEALGYRLYVFMPDIGFKMGRWISENWYVKTLCEKTADMTPPRPFARG